MLTLHLNRKHGIKESVHIFSYDVNSKYLSYAAAHRIGNKKLNL